MNEPLARVYLRNGIGMVDLEIELPVEIDLPDLTLTLPINDAIALQTILEALMETEKCAVCGGEVN